MISRRFWNWVDDRKIVRRSTLYFTLAMTAVAVFKGFDFAVISKFDGSGTAAIILAFTAPAAYLQKAVLDNYFNMNKGTPE